ncbi:MAG TPA: adenylate/guanylate cyclase domain-containing protein, partial [Candidatus Xenobia bacterium]
LRQIPSQQVRHRLTVPLTGDDDVFGTLQVVNKKSVDPFDTHDRQLLETFAGIASVAVQNARLLDRTRRLAEDLRQSLEKERWLAIEKSKMGAYIPKHVVDEISRNREQKLALGGKIVTATILFSDIQGFTRLSENMPPPRLVSFLNEYMTALTRAVEEQGGIVDKFIGDAIMAIFLPAGADDNQAARAVRAGVHMQEQIRLHADDWATRFPEVAHLQTRIGINTGEVVAGNIGSETRMDYTVIGDNVNVASRIESNGVGGQVHISESTWQAVKDAIQATRLEPIQVKNRVQPVHIYAVELGR